MEQDLVAGAGLESWYKTGIRWIGGRWSRTGICWCRRVFAGPGLVVAGVFWCRKVVAGSGLMVAGVCWCRKVIYSGFEDNTIVFRHTNELRNSALTKHNNESSLFVAWNVVCSWCCKNVVFRLVGCLRRNGSARCCYGSVLLDV